MPLALIAGIAAAALAFVYVLSQIREALRHRARAKELGCKPAVWMSGYDPTGIADVLYGVAAGHKKQFPTYVQENLEREAIKNGRPVGTLCVRTPLFRDTLVTTDPQNIQTILALKFKDFGLGVNRTDNFQPLLGHGIFATNGKQWERSRALLRPQFIRGQVSNLSLEEDHVKALMTVLDRRVGLDGWTDLVDLQPLFFRLTLDSATEFLFGESVNSQLDEGQPGSDKDASFSYAFDKAQYTLSVGARLGPHYWMIQVPEFHRMVKRVHDFVDYFVQKALTQGASKKSLENVNEEKYVFLNALAKETRDPEELRSQLLNILLAGRDTTASTLGWFFYTMADPRYASVFRRLRATILEEFGTYSNPKEITFEKMKSCQYLQWSLNECLRLYPAVPMNVRTAQVDTTLPTGGGVDGQSPIYIRKGQDVSYAVYIMHRRKDIWGPDAEIFKPERWETRRPGWDYLPFNGGPRICIGQQFALTEVGYVVIRMMQRIDSIDGSQVGPIMHGLTLTNCPGEGVNVKLHFAE
ncbi:cytochrome p450 52a12 [Trichoderma cornu-damae]|uniref:Cytochrome p450 52a12 n=1 Tax=Trichoderma cornu-damae TaxID=654480 RepID=A0A9P8QEA4_9HYPO|nr:cytochrome p450 52a12 [Trichoderma cornu-damae]